MDASATENERLAPALTEPRARIGLIIPSVNRMSEPQFNHYAPEGLGIHVARGRVAGQPARTVAELTDEIAHAAGTLADAGPDLIVFHCTHTSMKEGADGEARIIDLIRKTTGIAALSTSSLVERRAARPRRHKLVVLSPYQSNANIIAYLAAAGFSVVKDVALRCSSAAAFETVTPQRWLELAQENDCPEADGVFSELHQHEADRGGGRDRGRARQAGRQQQPGCAVGLPQAAQGKTRRCAKHAESRAAHGPP